MKDLYGPKNNRGFRSIAIHDFSGSYLDSYGNPVIILTPIKAVQGIREEKKLVKYLEKNHKKIAHGKIAFGPFPVTDGHMVYEIME